MRRLIIRFMFLGLSSFQLLSQTPDIRIFQDRDFLAMPEYNAGDVVRLLETGEFSCSTIVHKQLEGLEYV